MITFQMGMRRLVPIAGEKEKPIWAVAKHCGHKHLNYRFSLCRSRNQKDDSVCGEISLNSANLNKMFDRAGIKRHSPKNRPNSSVNSGRVVL